MKYSDIKIAILAMDEEVLNTDKLHKLIGLAPTPEEITQMQGYEGPKDELAACEQFFYQFITMENIKERLQIWSYKMSFNEDYIDHKIKVDLLSSMTRRIRESKGFKLTLASILACGNFINGGTKKGGKHGFELETLSKIASYKTTDATMSILGYIYKFLRENYPQSLIWIDEMSELPQVIRIETDNLDSEIIKMDKDLEKVKDLLSGDDKKSDDDDDDDQFGNVMKKFYNESIEKVEKLQNDFDCTKNDVLELAKFFGEKVKKSQFKLEEFFGIFNEFRNTFIENRDKIIKIEQDLNKPKKRNPKRKKPKTTKNNKSKKGKKKVGFIDNDKKEKKKKGRKNKTDKMLDEMGDAHKYLAKLRKNRKNKSKPNVLGTRKKSLYFKDRKQIIPDPTNNDNNID